MASGAPVEVGERSPCPYCAESIAADARLCHRCQSSVLVNVVLAGPALDPKLRYQLARQLHAASGTAALSDIQAGLGAQPPVAARAVTRAAAREVMALLERHAVQARMDVPSSPALDYHPAEDGFRWGRVAGFALAVLAVAGAWASWRHRAPHDGLALESPGPGRSEGSAEPMSGRAIAAQALPSTVSLRCRQSIGSGFFVTPDLVITNAHVLCEPGEPIQVVLSDGRTLTGTTERSNTDVDLGSVRVAGAKEKPLPMGDVADLAPGDKVTIIGSPMGLEFTVHEGNVSSLRRSGNGIAYIQLDAKINPGNSGGPVIDGHGRVVGVVTLKMMQAEGIGLALPINYAYGTSLHFVEAPSAQAARSPAFHKMVADAGANQDEGATYASSIEPPSEPSYGGPEAGSAPGRGRFDDRPLLAGATLDTYDRLVVTVVRAGATPASEEITMNVWSRTNNFCTLTGTVTSWREMAAREVVAASVVRALKAQGVERIFFGEAPLQWQTCNRDLMKRGVELELVGGMPSANRIVLQ
jgi:S1-C subfamily serine protease